MKAPSRIIIAFSIALFLIAIPLSFSSMAGSEYQSGSPEGRAANLLSRMTTEEKIGQLFLVTFHGNDVRKDTPIYDLIVQHHIGGVILKANNDNFTDKDTTINDLWILNNQLQTNNYLGSEIENIDPQTGFTSKSNYIPLLIGIQQYGDGFPNNNILFGLSKIPSQLSIGATWNSESAFQTGELLGSELSSLGINLLFGPSLDVVEHPLASPESDLGVNTFGGDPYWVGEMAKSYISGIHKGSDHKLLVAATHFPGLGSADRLPTNEVATVRKSLEQLKQIELAPFFEITAGSPGDDYITDALLTSHIRYQGLQGNIRATTKPISLDPQAFNLLMDIPEFMQWRQGNGLMISDDLASRSVRRFYDPTEQVFNARRPSMDALLAGNDLLYFSDEFTFQIGDLTEEDPYDLYFTTLLDILNYFIQKYSEDPIFAESVDNSVFRILTTKYRLYSFFTLSQVLPSGELIDNLGQNSSLSIEVSRESATLISPVVDDISTIFPEPPGLNDRIVIIVDNYTFRQCSTCVEAPAIDQDSFQEIITNLYGSQGSGLINPRNVSTYSYADLNDLLNLTGSYYSINQDITRATWIVFITLDISGNRPESLALRSLLSERPDLTRQKNVVAFATSAPYYLDATEVSKLTAYYGLYSKGTAFIDTAAKLLFQEIPNPEGSSPISIPGIGYDLISVTSPDINKTIPLTLYFPETLSDSELPQVSIGDHITITVGTILDYNGNPVPNNTPVEVNVLSATKELALIKSQTRNGVVEITYIIDDSPVIDIFARSGGAISEVFSLSVHTVSSGLTTPTQSPSQTPKLTSTLSLPTEMPNQFPEQPGENEPKTKLDYIDWGISTLTILIIALSAYQSSTSRGKVRRGIHSALASIIGGYLIFIYMIFKLPGTSWIFENGGRLVIGLLILLGAGAGWTTSTILRNWLTNSDN